MSAKFDNIRNMMKKDVFVVVGLDHSGEFIEQKGGAYRCCIGSIILWNADALRLQKPL